MLSDREKLVLRLAPWTQSCPNINLVILPLAETFDVPVQKMLVFDPSLDERDSEPILLAATDDRLAFALAEEARNQHKKRNKDDTPTTKASGEDIPFRLVDKPSRPEIRHDHGFLDDGNGNIDNSKRRSATLSDYARKAKWMAKLTGAELLRPDLIDATDAYRHFMTGYGTPIGFSYEEYAKKDRAGGQSIDSAVEDATAAALELHDMLGVGDFSMQASGIGVGGTNGRYPYPGTENWQKAIGAHVIWLEAHVQVTKASDKRTFVVDMTLHAEDRYNFNPGAADIATGTPDAENGRFEVTGLGHEFMNTSTLRRHIVFDAPTGPVPNYRQKPPNQVVTRPR